MSEKSEMFARQVDAVLTQFEAVLNTRDWICRRDPKRMRDDGGGVFTAPSLMLFKGSVRLLLDPTGYDVPGAEGVMDLYLLPPYDPVASLYLEGGKWFIHSPFPADLKAAASPTKWNRSPLTEASITRVFEDIAEHATPSV